MKKLAVKKGENECMACLTCENVCASSFYKSEDTTTQNLSCIQITGENNQAKVSVCVQCGKCAKSCEAKAISKNAKGVFIIDKKTCVNCGKCIEACPFGLVVKAKERETPSKCIACGICVKNCPMDILYIKEEADKPEAKAS
ncbi:MAG: 4Fe-4S binding protein [Spirochaetaceae bacterium]|jgi:Fe-S-cluster-containing hydrogenase component 2|nr:4Fe-4S binding protein [Spirochaetaceae bacterium]